MCSDKLHPINNHYVGWYRLCHVLRTGYLHSGRIRIMNEELYRALILCETDIEGSIKRFYGNEELYISLLESFLTEETMSRLNDAMEYSNWKKAFMEAHALKGLAGNLGFVPLFHSLGELILLLRADNDKDAIETYLTVKSCYAHVVEAISNNIYLTRKDGVI